MGKDRKTDGEQWPGKSKDKKKSSTKSRSRTEISDISRSIVKSEMGVVDLLELQNDSLERIRQMKENEQKKRVNKDRNSRKKKETDGIDKERQSATTSTNEQKEDVKKKLQQQRNIVGKLVAGYEKFKNNNRHLSNKNKNLKMAEVKSKEQIRSDKIYSQTSLSRKDLGAINRKFWSPPIGIKNVDKSEMAKVPKVMVIIKDITDFEEEMSQPTFFILFPEWEKQTRGKQQLKDKKPILEKDEIEMIKYKQCEQTKAYFKKKVEEQKTVLIRVRQLITNLKDVQRELEYELQQQKEQNGQLVEQATKLQTDIQKEKDTNQGKTSEINNLKETINLQNIIIDDLKLEVADLQKSNRILREKLIMLNSESIMNCKKETEMKDTSLNKILQKILLFGFKTLTFDELTVLNDSVRRASRDLTDTSTKNVMETPIKGKTFPPQKVGILLPPKAFLFYNDLSKKVTQTQKRNQKFKENILHYQRELFNIRCWYQDHEHYLENSFPNEFKKQHKSLLAYVKQVENQLVHFIKVAQLNLQTNEELEKKLIHSLQCIKQINN